jgi:tetratricopeptide (TPR) repeat protein
MTIISKSHLLLLFCLGAALLSAASPAEVKVWEENVVIPTYLAGEPEENPMFYFGRMSQGAEGRVYPYPLYDTLTGKKVDKTYRMVYLENEYIRVGILPEIGGRVFEGLDKTNNYHFFYRQHVIKPALIGLIGAWISGGIEWNIPHHHRASTFIPVQHYIQENPDGSKTVWVGELEVRHRMRWAVGYTLYPGKAYMEAKVRILNRTPVVNTMLCFANVAVHVNEDYQVIFPPGTQYGTHHHKREFTTWPVATGQYGGWDFSKGVDVSWFKNHVSANSIFAWNYEDDFVAGYDHGKRAGTMAVANHHVVPGKKLWTWGNGPRGRMWDHILTDEDGPYIEIMVGAYSDNQPDYSWLAPYEVKSFEMKWYPFRDIGGVKNASLEAAVNLDVKGGKAKVGFYTPAAHPAATVLLKAGEKILLRETVAINPGKPFMSEVALPEGLSEYDLRASISAGGKELIAYQPLRLEKKPQPEPVKPPARPEEIKTNEELYLTGLWIEQFHNPALDPDPYWEEALRRDPDDVRVNTALGVNYLKKARFADAGKLFRKALDRLAARHATPKDAEAQYYLGVALKAQGRYEEAFDALYQATWNLAWRAPGYYTLAEIATMRGEKANALDLVERSLEANALNIRALNLKAALLRHLGRKDEALQVLAGAFRKTDPLDVRTMAERWLAGRSPDAAKVLASTMNSHPATAAETAAEYMNAGLWQDGTDVLLEMVAAAPQKAKVSPMVYYYLGYFANKMGHEPKAAEYYQLAAKMPPAYVFPFQSEAIVVLRAAITAQPRDARAPYYLGNLLFDWQPEEAVKLWEVSASLDPSFPIVHRNLGIAYSHQQKGNALDKAIASLEKAVSLERKYPLHFYELDQLYEAAGTPPEKRLALLEKHHSIVAERDDALSREVALKVILGKLDEAIQLMTGREYEVWEGGALNVADYWTDAHILRAHQHREAGRYSEALAGYQAALTIPSNLPTERRGTGWRDAEVSYWVGATYRAQGDREKARQSWQASASAERVRRRWGVSSDTLSEDSIQAYYRGLSLQQLGDSEKAKAIFEKLIAEAKQAMEQSSAKIDYFASFGEQQSQRGRLALAHYVAGLGNLGLGDKVKAKEEMTKALEFSPDHLGARSTLARITSERGT